MAGARRSHPSARPPARRPLAVLTFVLASVLTACSGGGAADGTAGAAVVAADPATTALSGPDCLAPQVLAALGFAGVRPPGSTPHPDAPSAGPVPESFAPVSAVLCATGETLTDASGRWAAVTASRLEGDIHPLADALTSSSGSAATPEGGPTTCAAAAVRSDLWLVDAVGSAIRVALPGGGCGRLPSAVRAGLAALETVDLERSPVELVEPHATPSATP